MIRISITGLNRLRNSQNIKFWQRKVVLIYGQLRQRTNPPVRLSFCARFNLLDPTDYLCRIDLHIPWRPLRRTVEIRLVSQLVAQQSRRMEVLASSFDFVQWEQNIILRKIEPKNDLLIGGDIVIQDSK